MIVVLVLRNGGIILDSGKEKAMDGNLKSVSIHCTKTGIHVDGANNIGSTSDTIVSCKPSFLRVCEVWWNTYCGRDDEEEAQSED